MSNPALWLEADLEEFHGSAEQVPAVELGEGECPQDLRQEWEEGRQYVRQGEVQKEEVHPGHLHSYCWPLHSDQKHMHSDRWHQHSDHWHLHVNIGTS